MLKCTCQSCCLTKVKSWKATGAGLDSFISMAAIAGVPLALRAAAIGSSEGEGNEWEALV